MSLSFPAAATIVNFPREFQDGFDTSEKMRFHYTVKRFGRIGLEDLDHFPERQSIKHTLCPPTVQAIRVSFGFSTLSAGKKIPPYTGVV